MKFLIIAAMALILIDTSNAHAKKRGTGPRERETMPASFSLDSDLKESLRGGGGGKS